jgi:hypothetical protein
MVCGFIGQIQRQALATEFGLFSIGQGRMCNIHDVDIDCLGRKIHGNGVIKIYRGRGVYRKGIQVGVIHNALTRV